MSHGEETASVPPSGKRGDDGMEDYRAHIEAGVRMYGRLLDLDDAHIEDAVRGGMRAAVESYAQQQAGAVEALEKADALADAVIRWKSHVALEGLVGEYMSARHLRGGR